MLGSGEDETKFRLEFWREDRIPLLGHLDSRPGCLAYRQDQLAHASWPVSATDGFLRDAACLQYSVLCLTQSVFIALQENDVCVLCGIGFARWDWTLEKKVLGDICMLVRLGPALATPAKHELPARNWDN